MAGSRSAGYSHNSSLGIRIPVRSAESCQGRHEIDSSIVRNTGSQRVDLRGSLDDSKTIPEPLDDGAGHEDGPFESIVDSVPDLPGNSGKKIVAGHDRSRAAVHQQEAACPVGVLHRTRLCAHLSEKGRLLVTCDAGNRNLAAQEGCQAIDLGAGADLRHHRLRNIQNIQKLLVPLKRVDVEKHCAGGIGHISDMHRASREVPDEPGIHCSEAKLATVGLLACPRNIIKDPADLGPAEISIDEQSCLGTDQIAQTGRLERITVIRCSPVLPDDGIAERLACRGIPDYGGLPLVGYSYCCYIIAAQTESSHSLCHHSIFGSPDFHRVMLDPPRTGEMLGELFLTDGNRVPVLIENDCS